MRQRAPVVPAQQSFVLQLPNSSKWMWGGDIWGSAAETDGIKSHDTQTWLPFEFVGGHATAAAAAEPQTMGAAAGCRVS